MKQTGYLTNERLRDMFNNQFELVNYAIKLAEHFIKTGREPFIHHETKNLATQILEIIETGKDRFKDVDEATLITEIESTIVKINSIADEEDSESSQPEAVSAM